MSAAIGADRWDALMEGCGTSSVESLAMGEQVFRDTGRPQHDWARSYFVAFQADGEPVGATYATRSRTKDDMFMRAEVSEAVERVRRPGPDGDGDPYYLTTDAMVMGSPLSEGRHVGFAPALDVAERAAVWQALLEAFCAQAAAWGVEQLVVRDFPGDDELMDAAMHAGDWIKAPLPPSHVLTVDPAETEDEMVTRVTMKSTYRARARRFWRRLREASDAYEVRVHGWHAAPDTAPLSADERAHLYALYRSVADRKLRINDFALPAELLDALLASPAWEIVTVHRDPARGGPADGRAVAWGASHRHGGHYVPFLCGFDIEYVRGEEFGAYRQLLLAVVRRARAIGARSVHLGWDAEVEKARLGCELNSAACYVRHARHDHGEELQLLVNRLGLAAAGDAAVRPTAAWRTPAQTALFADAAGTAVGSSR